MSGSDIEKRLLAIEARNLKVESDKAWETSWLRRGTIAILTYAVIATYLLIIKNDKPFITAFVPAIGYLLSTLVLRKVKKLWQKNN